MRHTITIIARRLSDGSDVFAVCISNGIALEERIVIDAIAEDDARNMAECFQKAIEAYGNDYAEIAFNDVREG